jgi:hypothetical protein
MSVSDNAIIDVPFSDWASDCRFFVAPGFNIRDETCQPIRFKKMEQILMDLLDVTTVFTARRTNR